MNAFNRLLWLFVGASAIAAGVVGFGVTFDWWSSATINAAIPFRDVWQEWQDIDWSQTGARWILFAAGIVVAFASAAVAARQLARGEGHAGGDTLVIEQSERGRTTVSRSCLARGAAAEAQMTPGVENATVDQVTLVNDGVRARYRLTVDGGEAIPEVGTAVVDRGGRSLRQMLDRERAFVAAEIAVRHVTHEREVR